MPSRPYSDEAVFTYVDGILDRDGEAVFCWAGGAPEVVLSEAVAAPEDLVASATWIFELQPDSRRFLEVRFLGPPSTDVRSEEGLRQRFKAKSIMEIEEELRWEWTGRGSIALMKSASRAFWRSIIGNLFFLRLLGDANKEVFSLSDRPYGHPASDAAFEAEACGAMMQFSFDEVAVPFQSRLGEAAEARLPGLTPERRLAYLHGLAAGMRMAQTEPLAGGLVGLIREYVTEGLEVRPWLDPDVVRQDLMVLFEVAGEAGAEDLPRLAWAETEPDTVAGVMQACRRAITARDGDAAWRNYQSLLDIASARGMGGMVAGGELDGAYSVGMLFLARAMLIDDHGPALELLPAVNMDGLFNLREPFDSYFYPTRFGRVRQKAFYVQKKLMGFWIYWQRARVPERAFLRMPSGATVRKLQKPVSGGLVEIRENGEIDLAPTFLSKGMRWAVWINKEE